MPHRGEKGDKGDAGLSAQVRRAIVFLFVLAVMLAAIGLIAVVREQGTLAAQQKALAVQQKELTRQARAGDRQRCASIALIVDIPIPVPLAGNPSRQAWAAFEGVERMRGRELGCALPPPRYAPAG